MLSGLTSRAQYTNSATVSATRSTSSGEQYHEGMILVETSTSQAINHHVQSEDGDLPVRRLHSRAVSWHRAAREWLLYRGLPLHVFAREVLEEQIQVMTEVYVGLSAAHQAGCTSQRTQTRICADELEQDDLRLTSWAEQYRGRTSKTQP